MANLGKKHECVECGAKFYDLGRDEIVCPKCGTNQDEDAKPPVKPKKAAPAKAKKDVIEAPEPDEEDDGDELDDDLEDEDDDEDEELDDDEELDEELDDDDLLDDDEVDDELLEDGDEDEDDDL